MAFSTTTSSSSPYLLWALLILLLITASIEVGFVSSMVRFLNTSAHGPFAANINGQTVELAGHPQNMANGGNAGHLSNAAATSTIILIYFGGWIALWAEGRKNKYARSPSLPFRLWALAILAVFILTLAAFALTFAMVYTTKANVIDLGLVATINNTALYPDDEWTPETWFAAVLAQVPLADQADADLIERKLRLMRGYRWTLLPLWLLQLVLVVVVALRWRRARGEGARAARRREEQGRAAAAKVGAGRTYE